MKISLSLILFSTCMMARNPDAVGKHGMVVSSHALASEVGINILKKGGNAIDAAIATGFALSVVHPGAGNIGGGGFMVIRLANGDVTSVDFMVINKGKKTAAGHFGKAVKGKFIRYIAQNKIVSTDDFGGFEYEGFNWDGESFIKEEN